MNVLFDYPPPLASLRPVTSAAPEPAAPAPIGNALLRLPRVGALPPVDDSDTEAAAARHGGVLVGSMSPEDIAAAYNQMAVANDAFALAPKTGKGRAIAGAMIGASLAGVPTLAFNLLGRGVNALTGRQLANRMATLTTPELGRVYAGLTPEGRNALYDTLPASSPVADPAFAEARRKSEDHFGYSPEGDDFDTVDQEAYNDPSGWGPTGGTDSWT